MNDLTGALCRGRWWLFDSTDMRDHSAARDLCAQCPALTACARELREVQTATRTLRGSGGGPVGTWAGKLLGKKGYRHEYEIPDCGTDKGYYRHRGQREAACVDCKAAHAAVTRGTDHHKRRKTAA